MLPLPVARGFWFSALFGTLVVVLPLSVRTLPERRRPVGMLLAVLIVCLGKSYVRELVLGQSTCCSFLSSSAECSALKAGREARAGWLVALAIMVKPYTLILVPWLLARGRRPSVVAVATGMAVAFLLPATIYGLAGSMALHLDWWRTVSATTARTLTSPDNVSLAAMLPRSGPARPPPRTRSRPAAPPWRCSASRRPSFFAEEACRSRTGSKRGFFMALTPLVSPQGWDYVLVVCTPAVVCLVNNIDRLPRALRLLSVVAVAAIGLTLFNLVGRTVYYTLIGMSVITLGVVVVIGMLGVLRARKVA